MNTFEQYFTKENNVADFKSCQDYNGRWVLPLDTVVFRQKTDEGKEVIISGVIKRVFENYIEVELPKFIGEGCVYVTSDKICRLPVSGSLFNSLLDYFTSMNIAVGMTYGKLHINGVRVI